MYRSQTAGFVGSNPTCATILGPVVKLVNAQVLETCPSGCRFDSYQGYQYFKLDLHLANSIVWEDTQWLINLMMGYNLVFTPIIIRTMYRGLIQKGFSKEDSANLIARLMGLKKSKTNWTVDQLSRLLFLEYLDKSDKL